MRKLFNPHQKAKLALETIKGDKTFLQLSSEYQVHASTLSEWKQILETRAHTLFGPNGKTREEQKIAELERMIGQREADIDWLKKKLPQSLP